LEIAETTPRNSDFLELRRMSYEMSTEYADQKVSLVDPILKHFAHRWFLT
jgi:hypothetical protein